MAPFQTMRRVFVEQKSARTGLDLGSTAPIRLLCSVESTLFASIKAGPEQILYLACVVEASAAPTWLAVKADASIFRAPRARTMLHAKTMAAQQD